MPTSQTATVTARVPREVKRHAEQALEEKGMTPTEVINRLYSAIAYDGAFPEKILPDPHAFPKPGERHLDRQAMQDLKAISPKQKLRCEAFERHLKFKVDEWGTDLNRPYQEIIAEERDKRYEAFS